MQRRHLVLLPELTSAMVIEMGGVEVVAPTPLDLGN